MGNLKVNGKARCKFTADLMEIIISVSTEGETAAYAIRKGKKETEKVLNLLVELGIDLSKVKMKTEDVTEPRYYNDDEGYRFEKKVSFMTKADLKLLERLSAEISEREIDATYRECFGLTDSVNIGKQVLRAALLESRKKAELIAETFGQKIVGIELAKCDDYRGDDEEDVYDTKFFLAPNSGPECLDSLSEQLSPDTIIVEKSVDVSWIVE